ncbi:MAG: TetR/AcrR family transcriptional regulator [Pseudomonadales bacterium]
MSGTRQRQKQRTRKDLLRAAARLLARGVKPTLDEVAEEAMVSRATAYRYFSNVDALLLESTLDISVPEPEALFAESAGEDVVARVQRADDALNAMIAEQEAPLRLMLAKSLERSIGAASAEHVPLRQNRRTGLIEAALAPLRGQVRTRELKLLTRALALVLGTEAHLVLKDVLQLDDTQALAVKRWTIRALVNAVGES